MNQQEQQMFLTHAMALGLAIAFISEGTGTAVEDIEDLLWTTAKEAVNAMDREEVEKDFNNYRAKCEEKGATMFCIRVDPPDEEV